MLVRAIGRSREVALRAVLGASPVELTRMFVMESALLCTAGVVAGIALGSLGLRALIAYGPPMPGLTVSSLDTRAVLFAVAIAVIAGLVVATYPAVMLLRKRQIGLTVGGRAIGGRGTSLLRSGFVVAQFALALPLLAISGLLLLSFVRMQQVDPGFDPRNLLTVYVSLPTGQYPDSAATEAYWARALPRVRELAGVASVGVGTSMPPNDFGNSNDNFNLVDRPAPPGTAEPNAPWPQADAGYFATLGVRLLDGRQFVPGDGPEAPAVLVSRSWVERFYPRESPLGKKMVRGGCTDCPLSTIVGVVDDVRYSGLDGPLDAMYSPAGENWPRSVYLFVRTATSPEELAAPVRNTLRSVDPSVPLDDVASMEERLYTAVAQPRQWATLLGAFAAAALGLAAVGVFGMLSYSVSTRRREIGVRMAVGAQPRRIIRMVVGSGITHAIIGSAIGVGAALLGTQALTNVLFDVQPGDPVMLGLATLALLVVALVACWLPARRAAAIDPLEAIRAE
jgi:putative ABC transport system permease protein